MFLTNLLGFKRKCNHDLITPDMESGYCPECGEFIENQWYITRCTCCGLKLRTTQRGNSIEPQNTYCSNCGSTEFKVIKLEKINFIDINFAVLIKKVLNKEESDRIFTQCWQEKTNEKPKLLGLYQ